MRSLRSPVVVSQRRIVLSSLPVASSLPSGEKATAWTRLVCPLMTNFVLTAGVSFAPSAPLPSAAGGTAALALGTAALALGTGGTAALGTGGTAGGAFFSSAAMFTAAAV